MDVGTGTWPLANSFEAFSLILLAHEQRYLLLQRAEWKRFAPNRWTGIGGRVEPHELGELRASALRELAEETGLRESDVSQFALRRVLLHNRPTAPLTLLVYFTGLLAEAVTPTSPEGTLHWVSRAEFGKLDIIDSAAAVLPLLIDDLARDPLGLERACVGAAHYNPDGVLERVVWA